MTRTLRGTARRARLAAEALGTLGAVAIAVRTGRLRRLLRRLRRRARAAGARRGSPREGDAATTRSAVRAVDVLGRRLPGVTCLDRALSAAWMLARRGHGGRLVVGVREADGEVRAHAWLEQDGAAVSAGSGADGFVPLWSEPVGER